MSIDLFIDIETIPCQREGIREHLADRIDPPGNMTKAETIAKWEEEKKPEAVEAAYRGTALDGTFGEVIVIGWAIDDGPAHTFSREVGHSEAILLGGSLSAFDELRKAGPGQWNEIRWVGHNILGFDLRFLWQRCVINRVRPSVKIPHDARPWDSDRVFDTKLAWAGVQRQSVASMRELCPALGIEDHDTIDGSQVWDHIQAGDMDTVVEHCKQDVEKTRELFKRMTFQGES